MLLINIATGIRIDLSPPKKADVSKFINYNIFEGVDSCRNPQNCSEYSEENKSKLNLNMLERYYIVFYKSDILRGNIWRLYIIIIIIIQTYTLIILHVNYNRLYIYIYIYIYNKYMLHTCLNLISHSDR